MKWLIKMCKLYITINIRQGDLWKYNDWDKTYRMEEKFHKELSSKFSKFASILV